MKKNHYRVSKSEPYEHLIKLGNVKYPVSVNDIPTLEKLNDLRINVFAIEDKEICPLYISPREDDDVINMLVIETEDQTHYTLIRDFSRLLGDLTRYNGKLFYYYRCLHRFHDEKNLKEHHLYCKEHQTQRISLPQEGKDDFLSFTAIKT